MNSKPPKYLSGSSRELFPTTFLEIAVYGHRYIQYGPFLFLCFLLQVVVGKSVAEVAQNVIKHVRLSLLTPEELKQVEQENEKDKMIPVSASLES